MHSLNTISFSFGFCLISGIVISFHGARADTIRVAACRAARFPISGALTTLFVVPNINYFRRSGQRGCVSLQYLPLPSSADCLQRAVFGVLGVIKRWGGGGGRHVLASSHSIYTSEFKAAVSMATESGFHDVGCLSLSGISRPSRATSSFRLFFCIHLLKLYFKLY